MGYELLDYVTGILERAGIRTGEEYPAGQFVEILSPVAAVGLRELDCESGEARFTVRVLSPRILGGWCCQTAAAKAVCALSGAGMACQTGEMEFLSGSDCFCVTVTASLAVFANAEGWEAGRRWRVFVGDAEQTGVTAFTAVRNQGRRVVGAFCQSEPVAVTPGNGGWELTLVQGVTAEPEDGAEPFTLTLRDDAREVRYTGCCWNVISWEHTQRGMVLTRKGFALGREVNALG